MVPVHWKLEQKICAMFAHFSGVFESKQERDIFLTDVILSSYSHFDLDDSNAPGLWNKIQNARKMFPSKTNCEISSLSDSFHQIGVLVRRTAKKSSSLSITLVLMASYVQDVAALVLGDSLYVDPLLRWIVKQA
jgi:hypothetical protein